MPSAEKPPWESVQALMMAVSDLRDLLDTLKPNWLAEQAQAAEDRRRYEAILGSEAPTCKMAQGAPIEAPMPERWINSPPLTVSISVERVLSEVVPRFRRGDETMSRSWCAAIGSIASAFPEGTPAELDAVLDRIRSALRLAKEPARLWHTEEGRMGEPEALAGTLLHAEPKSTVDAARLVVAAAEVGSLRRLATLVRWIRERTNAPVEFASLEADFVDAFAAAYDRIERDAVATTDALLRRDAGRFRKALFERCGEEEVLTQLTSLMSGFAKDLSPEACPHTAEEILLSEYGQSLVRVREAVRDGIVISPARILELQRFAEVLRSVPASVATSGWRTTIDRVERIAKAIEEISAHPGLAVRIIRELGEFYLVQRPDEIPPERRDTCIRRILLALPAFADAHRKEFSEVIGSDSIFCFAENTDASWLWDDGSPLATGAAQGLLGRLMDVVPLWGTPRLSETSVAGSGPLISWSDAAVLLDYRTKGELHGDNLRRCVSKGKNKDYAALREPSVREREAGGVGRGRVRLGAVLNVAKQLHIIVDEVARQEIEMRILAARQTSQDGGISGEESQPCAGVERLLRLARGETADT